MTCGLDGRVRALNAVVVIALVPLPLTRAATVGPAGGEVLAVFGGIEVPHGAASALSIG
jgi:hypothetical protein